MDTDPATNMTLNWIHFMTKPKIRIPPRTKTEEEVAHTLEHLNEISYLFDRWLKGTLTTEDSLLILKYQYDLELLKDFYCRQYHLHWETRNQRK